MNLHFLLNGRSVAVQTRPETLLVELLRGEFGLTGTRAGCMQGECGICSVLLDDKLVLACMIPAFRTAGLEVTTIEGFSETDAFEDIATGFGRAGMDPCHYCVAAKVLLAHWIIEQNPSPSRPELERAVASVQCRCTVYTRFMDGIRFAAETRRKRLSVRVR